MKLRMFLSFTTILLLVTCTAAALPDRSSEITVDELRQHVKYLASEKLEGRRPGTTGNDLAAQYIANEFAQYGLKPLGDNGTYFQSFQFVSGVEADKKNALAASVLHTSLTFTLDRDFRPVAFSADTSVTAGLVFVGYGISDDSLQFDEYAHVDVRGKIVMVLRFTPDYSKHDSKFDAYAPLYRKAFIAREKGAAGMILVTGPADESQPGLMALRIERDFRTVGIAAVNLRSDLADSLLRLAGIQKNLKTIQQEIYDTKAPSSFEVHDVSITMRTDVIKKYSRTANVLGYLEGSHPERKKQVVILGAHFDHLGWGGEGSGSMQPDTNAIHFGADDNASGSAALLELAQAMSAAKKSLQRSYIFAAFSAEEMGLLGASHYVKNPTSPIENTIAMFNLDMVGRLRDSSLYVQGVGSSPIWKTLVDDANTSFGFNLRLGQDGHGPSDHASFYAKDIPVLFFFTGTHPDYHRPSDTWEKINYDGKKAIAEFVYKIGMLLDGADKPEFTRVQVAAAGMRGRGGMRTVLGVVPDFGEDAEGLRITGTRAGTPAEKAGLQSGDIIKKLGGKEIKNLYDLTYVLQDHRAGDKLELVFKRGDEMYTVEVILEGQR